MQPNWADFIRGAEWLWLSWLVLLVSTGGLVYAVVRQCRFQSPAAVWRDERGLSATLAFVLTIPLMLLICGLFAELTFLLLAKFGTVYASYAAARSAAVWEAQPKQLREERIRAATITAMAPFAIQARSAGALPSLPQASDASAAAFYVLALRRFSRNSIQTTKVAQQFLATGSRTSVKLTIKERASGQPVSAEVTYQAGFLIPGIGRLLDPDGFWPWQYPIKSTTALPLELPVSSNKKLGIDYESF
jgi:hypothetical protein